MLETTSGQRRDRAAVAGLVVAILMATLMFGSCGSAETAEPPRTSRVDDIQREAEAARDADGALAVTSVDGKPTILVLPCPGRDLTELKVQSESIVTPPASSAQSTEPVERKYGDELIIPPGQPTSVEGEVLFFELTPDQVAEVERGLVPQVGLQDPLVYVSHEFAGDDGSFSSGSSSLDDLDWPEFPKVQDYRSEDASVSVQDFDDFAAYCER